MIYFAFKGDVDIIAYLLIAAITWMFGRAFRIAIFEIDKIRDDNLLISIFSGCISFVAMVVAIIALFISQN